MILSLIFLLTFTLECHRPFNWCALAYNVSDDVSKCHFSCNYVISDVLSVLDNTLDYNVIDDVSWCHFNCNYVISGVVRLLARQ